MSAVHALRPIDALLSRLENLKPSGRGYRARCPSCGGTSGKVAITEGDNGAVLVHCFGGCPSGDVIGAVGLKWADLMPPRHWPESPAERKAARRAIREIGWASALDVLRVESGIALMASRQLERWQVLSVEDDDRVSLAAFRIETAALTLCEIETFRPDEACTPQAVRSRTEKAAASLRRELAEIERKLAVLA